MAADGKLHEDALRMAVDKNLADIRTLLLWAEQAKEVAEKVGHITHALDLLTEIRDNLTALR